MNPQNSNSRLTLGKTCLEKYLAQPEELSEEKKKELDKLIQELGGPEGDNALISEKSSLNHFCEKRAKCTYKRLDPSFLCLSDIINYKNQDIQLPRFSVYKLYGENAFSISIYPRGLINKKIKISISESNIPEIFHDRILKSFEFSSQPESDFYGHHKFKVQRRIFKKYDRICGNNWDVFFSSKLQGVFPKETKEKIREAEKIFKKDQLYLISEKGVGEQQANENSRESLLLIGIQNEDCFLLDNFKMNPTEKY